MEDNNMACENTPTELAEGVHKGIFHQDRDTCRGWRALLQQACLTEHFRIAQELRHTLLQGAFSTSMQLCLVNERLPVDSATKPFLSRPLYMMRKVFEKGRGALQGRRSPSLPNGSLEKALGDISDDFSPGSRTRLRMVIVGETRTLAPEVQEQMYWIAREALLNALRHSAANRVEAEIEYLPRKLRVVVRDDGAGIDPKTLRSGRDGNRGLTSMQGRAASIGAKLRVWSKPGGGTEVEISLPLRKPA